MSKSLSNKAVQVFATAIPCFCAIGLNFFSLAVKIPDGFRHKTWICCAQTELHFYLNLNNGWLRRVE